MQIALRGIAPFSAKTMELLLAAMIIALPLAAQNPAQTKPASHTPAPVQQKPADTGTVKDNTSSNPAKITDVAKVIISPSRTTVSRHGVYGIYADIQNISPDPLILKASEISLVIQPEVFSQSECAKNLAFFPTQPSGDAEITLLSEEHYTVFWEVSSCRNWASAGGWLANIKDLLGFVPGDYAFTVIGIAHDKSGDGTKDVAHTFTETASMKVGLSLATTAGAAFFGGLLAYIVVFLQPNQDVDKWRPETTAAGKTKVIGIWFRNALAAGLLAASVTIIASRLSDTQFPIKVSVNDFWGALTIGFISYFIGTKFILTLAGKLLPPSNTPNPNQNPPPPPPQNPDPPPKPAPA
jgi:hypothetical protein